ncbi:unnamed protein product [Rotaria sp. Silwood2]|nr:unnamed protein product [Rotaria sp. Silwood2]CAF3229638.1 unnamed protein product [Rotaria sp. Silwood2]CAF3324286.1 unnamed protein product [Rotaria sp. Silwood2]CAF3565821.1 unnamed protein product [Rotaria sp. Silwood2]CAF4310229.1 unnamed protein product [Rotaria sp. Silwood2]
MATKTNPESNNSNDPLEQLDSLLVHGRIEEQQLTAGEYIDIDSSIPAFNEWDDDEHLKVLVQVGEEANDDDELVSVTEKPPNLPEVMEMMRKPHLFASTQQPQLYNLISDLELQLTDIYLYSKATKQSSIKDYFATY